MATAPSGEIRSNATEHEPGLLANKFFQFIEHAASSAAIFTRTRITFGGRCPMSSSRRASITARRVPASSTFTRPFRTSGALLLNTASRRANDSGKRENFEHAGHVLQA